MNLIIQNTENTTIGRRWFYVSLASLIISGLMSLFLILARTPFISPYIPDPLFFRRGLVVHVDLALIVWVYSFIAALFHTFIPVSKEFVFLKKAANIISILGVLLIVVSAYLPGAKPILSNYIPVIEHPIFLVGLALFFLGLFLSFIDPEILPSRQFVSFKSSASGFRISVILFFIAIQTQAMALANTTLEYGIDSYFEILFWGSGHILQMASESSKVAVWLIIVQIITNKELDNRWTWLAFAGYLLPLLILLPFLNMKSPSMISYRNTFTELMRFGIFPFTTILLIISIQHLKKYKISLDTISNQLLFYGFIVSVSLTILGYVLGFLIQGSNTTIPAHYHAAIGAVTASFMTITYVVMEKLNFSVHKFPYQKLVSYQPMIFGLGQAIFSIGFALAGRSGMERKVYGAEQNVRTLVEYFGLTLVGVGGFLAVIGGLLYIWFIVYTLIKERKIQENLTYKEAITYQRS